MSGAVRLGLRTKLLAILAVATLSFSVLIVTSKLTEDKVEGQLALLARRHVPKLELGPKLENQLEALRRNFQDAVAAQDADALEQTHAAKDELLAQLSFAGTLLDRGAAARARAAITAYFGAGYDVSRRLLAQETGEELVDSIAAMQRKYAQALSLLKAATSLDQRELAAAFAQASNAQAAARRQRLALGLACLLTVFLLSLWLSRSILRSVAEFSAGLGRFGSGDFSAAIRVTSRDEFGALAAQANQMAQNLERFRLEREQTDWLRAGHAGLLHALQGDLDPREVAEHAARFLAHYLEAPATAIYAVQPGGASELLGQYGGAAGLHASTRFEPGEGLVGQAARERELCLVSSLPAGYLRIRSGLGEAQPCTVALLPLIHVGAVTGVLEIALLKRWQERDGELLQAVRETLAVTLEVALARARLRELLAQTQSQAERLAAQEEELRATNEELQVQQEELREANQELTERTAALQEQQKELEHKNLELTAARKSLETKAEELGTVSAYKTQFLANMSHELRTPLNSMLLLSGLLADNESGNLSDKQVEFCRTIHQAGKDLLALINQVLDLSKVESGKQDVQLGPVALEQLASHARRMFEPLARDKQLELRVLLEPRGLPGTIVTDGRRVEQILNNLLGNSIKFTERGSVTLRIAAPGQQVEFTRPSLARERCVTLSVIDTGIGIDPAHLERIFVPFEQIESSQDRRYGGTGLGLSIARELAALLGGELQVQSAPGQGSSFLLHLPFEPPAGAAAHVRPPAPPLRTPLSQRPAPSSAAQPQPVSSDGAMQPAELLVIEDDVAFAGALGELIKGLGLAHVTAPDGETGLMLARTRRPSGIVLDVRLSDMDGFTLMEMLRADPRTAAIPVHFVSALEAPERGLALGAIGYLTKPASREDLTRAVQLLVPQVPGRACRILIVEDDAVLSDSLLQLLAGDGFEARRATSGAQAFEMLAAEPFQCVVLDLGLPDMDGLELLQALPEKGLVPPAVIVYTGRALSRSELSTLEAYTDSVVLKEGPALERLLDELRLFARRLQQGRSPRTRVAAPSAPALRLQGRKILVADDDMRAVYALSALLRAKGVEPLVADTGRAALEVLAEHPDVEVVLMDIMMPEMDGYEAMRRIRQDPRFVALPIIALTAKAMKTDQQKCLEAGATGYLAKPIDPELLFTLLESTLAHGLAHAG